MSTTTNNGSACLKAFALCKVVTTAENPCQTQINMAFMSLLTERLGLSWEDYTFLM